MNTKQKNHIIRIHKHLLTTKWNYKSERRNGKKKKFVIRQRSKSTLEKKQVWLPEIFQASRWYWVCSKVAKFILQWSLCFFKISPSELKCEYTVKRRPYYFGF
jgi:hypothetical protein